MAFEKLCDEYNFHIIKRILVFYLLQKQSSYCNVVHQTSCALHIIRMHQFFNKKGNTVLSCWKNRLCLKRLKLDSYKKSSTNKKFKIYRLFLLLRSACLNDQNVEIRVKLSKLGQKFYLLKINLMCPSFSSFLEELYCENYQKLSRTDFFLFY